MGLAARAGALLLAVALVPGPVGAQEAVPAERCGARPSLTYLANAAVLIRGTSSIMIDGPFTHGVEPYPTMTSRALQRARSADPPFDEVEWVLISHAHADHFDSQAVVDFLVANRTARLVSTREVVSQVRAAAPRLTRLDDRLIVAEPAEGESTLIRERAPRIEALALHHGRQRSIRNLGFLVDLDGIRLLHAGDAEVVRSDIEPLGLSERRIDFAVLPTWYARSERYRPALDAIGARQVLLMHFPQRRAAGRIFRRSGGWDAVMQMLRGYELPIVPLVRRHSVHCLGDPTGPPAAGTNH